MIQFNESVERHLRIFKNNKIDPEESDFDGPALVDPEVYPDEEIEDDIQTIDDEVSKKDRTIQVKSRKYEKLLKRISKATSDRKKRHLAQRAGNLQREIDKIEQDCDKLFVRRSVISGIRHVRSQFKGLDIDLSFDEAIDNSHIEKIEAELEEFLVEQGYEEESLKGIMETLDMELQRDPDEYLEATDSYSQRALEEAQQIEAAEADTSAVGEVDEDMEMEAEERVEREMEFSTA